MAVLTLTNSTTDTIVTLGVTGNNANSGGRVGTYSLMPGQSMPVEVELYTLLNICGLENTTIPATAPQVDSAEKASED